MRKNTLKMPPGGETAVSLVFDFWQGALETEIVVGARRRCMLFPLDFEIKIKSA